MLKRVEPRQDAYGNLIRASFFADYVELLAVKGHRNRLSLLRDLIEDNYGQSRQILQRPNGGQPEEWVPGDIADAAWTCLSQRADILGDLYPFEVGSSRLRLRAGREPRESTYIGLLAISLGHAFAEVHDLQVENLFEAVVGDALEGVGLAVGRFGEIAREKSLSFEGSMKALGLDLSVPTYPNAVARRVSAQDAGVDIVGHLDWSDARAGRWLFIGQVTCAKSSEWLQKLHEPSPDDWMKYFGEMTPPVPFLAVPYHVEDAAYEHLSGHRRHVLDRLRIVRSMQAVSPELRGLIDALTASDVQTFAVT